MIIYKLLITNYYQLPPEPPPENVPPPKEPPEKPPQPGQPGAAASPASSAGSVSEGRISSIRGASRVSSTAPVLRFEVPICPSGWKSSPWIGQ